MGTASAAFRFGRLAEAVRRFRSDASGAGAVEFALIAPVIVLLYLGGSELGIALSIDRKVKLAATTIADVSTQIDNPDASGIGKLLALAPSIVHPYPAGDIETTLTAVWIDDKGKGTVDCSVTAGGTADAKGKPYVLPPQLALMKSRSVIVAKVKLPYAPVSGVVWRKGWDIDKTAYFNPRNNARYKWNGC